MIVGMLQFFFNCREEFSMLPFKNKVVDEKILYTLLVFRELLVGSS